MPKKVLDETQTEVVAPEDSVANEEDEDIDEMNPDLEDEEEEDTDEDEDGEEVDEEDLEDDEADQKPKPAKEEPQKPAQSPEENAKYAAARRASEKKEQDTRRRLDTFLQANGYSSYEDFINSNGLSAEEEQGLREEARKMGYDADAYVETHIDEKYVKTLRKKDEATRLKEEVEKARRDRIQSDLESFTKNYPTVNVTELVKDPNFAKFAKGKTETQSLLEIYNDYVDLFGAIRQKSAEKIVSKQQRSTGSGGSSNVTLSARQRTIMNDWNKRYPSMPMKPEDFAD